MTTEQKTYKAIAAHWNGACYSSDGEDWNEYNSLQEAIDAADEMADTYGTDGDGDPCDVDMEWQVWGEYSHDPIKTISIARSVGEAAQDDCDIVAKREGEYTTDYVGTNSDDELVKWSRNGGRLGAHDRMDSSKGRSVERYDVPKEIDQLEWLKLAVDYGCDYVNELMVDAIELGGLEDDAKSDTAHWLDAAEGLWLLTVYAIEVDPGKLLAWSHTDENGIDDVSLIDASEWEDFAENLADEIGEVVDVESGRHYTNTGIQYQPSTGYDHDGFEIVVVRRGEVVETTTYKQAEIESEAGIYAQDTGYSGADLVQAWNTDRKEGERLQEFFERFLLENCVDE